MAVSVLRSRVTHTTVPVDFWLQADLFMQLLYEVLVAVKVGEAQNCNFGAVRSCPLLRHPRFPCSQVLRR